MKDTKLKGLLLADKIQNILTEYERNLSSISPRTIYKGTTLGDKILNAVYEVYEQSEKDKQHELRQHIENEIARILTVFEDEYSAINLNPIEPSKTISDMYDLLVKIQNNWEDIIADI